MVSMLRPSLLRSCLGCAASLLALACSGGGGGGAHVVVDPLWTTIDAAPTLVAASTIDLHGSAYCDRCPPSEVALGVCPEIQPPIASDVGVMWSNQTTGATGEPFHAITGQCACLFSYCTTSYAHRWFATVPLAIGPNVIEVMALDGAHRPGTSVVTITRTPAAPLDVEAHANGGDITLRWSPVDDATAYDLDWSTTATFEPGSTHAIVDVVSPFVHAGLTRDVTYFYRVFARSPAYTSPPSSVAWATAGWRSEVLVSTPPSALVEDVSIAIDSLDHVHVHASYDEHVDGVAHQFNRYWTNVSGSWASSLVALSSQVDANLALCTANDVHVDYFALQGLAHAVIASGNLSSEIVDASAWCDSSLTLDSAQHASVAYRALQSSPTSTGELRFATNASGTWSHVAVDAANLGCGAETRTISLALDPQGDAHITYAGAYPTNGLKHASFNGGAWRIVSIDSSYVASVSSAIDVLGRSHVVWCDGAGVLRYARDDGHGAWVFESIDSSGPTTSPSIALTPDGSVHVSYASGSNGGGLRYATKSSGSWRIVDIADHSFAPTAIALDSALRVHIAYFADGALKYATNE